MSKIDLISPVDGSVWLSRDVLGREAVFGANAEEGGDEMVEDAVKALVASTATGQIGDGKIFVLDVAKAVRIRTGETDAEAV